MVELMLATDARNVGSVGFAFSVGLGVELRSDDPDQSRRLLAIAAIPDGESRIEAARTGDARPSDHLPLSSNTRAGLRSV